MWSKWRTSLVLSVGVVLGVGLTLGYSAIAARPGLPWQQLNLFAEVYQRVHTDYVDEIADERLIAEALRGMVGSLDSYSTYLEPVEYDDLRTANSGSYAGIGIEVSTEHGELKVMSTVASSPAARAGIVAGDVVIGIDSALVDPQHLQESVAKLRGKPGAAVRLDIHRNGAAQPLHFELVRRKVQVQSVRSQLLEPGYGYVRIKQFTETTATEFSAALEDLRRSGKLTGVLLDLRGNPGGVLEAATEVADALLEQGTIVSAKGRVPLSTFTIAAKPGDLLHGTPLVVLVNSDSASASEILAGALRDNGRARLVGQTTFGKGLVQTVIGVAHGGAVKLTTSRFLTPSGASIHGLGIAPDVVLQGASKAPAAAAADDEQVTQALAELKSSAVRPVRAAVMQAIPQQQ
jgi:carboxyl-terminal processing protease